MPAFRIGKERTEKLGKRQMKERKKERKSEHFMFSGYVKYLLRREVESLIGQINRKILSLVRNGL
jgi:hypothetical protein